MNGLDLFLLFIYGINIIILPYKEPSKFSEGCAWACAILMLLRLHIS